MGRTTAIASPAVRFDADAARAWLMERTGPWSLTKGDKDGAEWFYGTRAEDLGLSAWFGRDDDAAADLDRVLGSMWDASDHPFWRTAPGVEVLVWRTVEDGHDGRADGGGLFTIRVAPDVHLAGRWQEDFGGLEWHNGRIVPRLAIDVLVAALQQAADEANLVVNNYLIMTAEPRPAGLAGDFSADEVECLLRTVAELEGDADAELSERQHSLLTRVTALWLAENNAEAEIGEAA